MPNDLDVTAAGAVLLGSRVACDGFFFERPVRVQTHVHEDHMDGFESSKSTQHIFCSKPTRALLVADQNADLPFRSNLIGLDYGVWCQFEEAEFKLVENGHMLGSAQVVVKTSGGSMVGYSGDFSGAVEEPIHCDCLVVDSTCGDPKLVRQHSQELAEEELLQLLQRSLVIGPVFLRASRGTLHRALVAMNGNSKYPLVGSERLIREAAVYREYGQPVGDILAIKSDDGKEAIASGRYVRVIGRGDRTPVDTSTVIMVQLTARIPSSTAVCQYSDRSFGVALTDHADFEETVEYVLATGAKEVITDSSRSNHAESLARAIRRKLGVAARASQNTRSYELGG